MTSNMPVPPHFPPRGHSEPVEDCRDFLRTGRCKYGASCKYNHPPNVQSGGGMREPLDPSEPLFPLRPSEPVCQYYAKHGTCKFGQACKFNHPPQASLQTAVSGSTIFTRSTRKQEAPQLILSPVVHDTNGSSMMLQLLPQRPDEPNCIYFLKNGQCKYGATCRYHHPVGNIPRQQPRQHRVPVHDPYKAQKVQYIAQNIPGYPQGHIVVSDSPVTFLSMDNNTGHYYQPVSFVSNSDGGVFCAATSSAVPTEQGSSTSSISSSFDTATSSLEQLAAQGDVGALWYRSRRHGSGSSLNAYNSDAIRSDSRGAVFPHSVSDGNIASTRSRAASYGSASDYTPQANDPIGHWRNERTIDHNHVRPGGTQYIIEAGRGRPPMIANQRIVRRSQRSGEGDEGFTMMTSALLSILDQPEDGSADSVNGDTEIQQGPEQMIENQGEYDPIFLQRLSMNSHFGEDAMSGRLNSSTWSPTWNGARSHPEGSPPDSTSGSRPIQQHFLPGPSSPRDSDIGLYLP